MVALEEDDDDWDKVEVNQGEKQNPGAITFYNRNPVTGNEPKLDKFSGKGKSETMGGIKSGGASLGPTGPPAMR